MTKNPRTVQISDEDIDALTRIIDAEARSQGPAGRLGVLTTILNRAAVGRDRGFEPTVQGVIMQRNQFEPLNGKKSWRDLRDPGTERRAETRGFLEALTSGELTDPTRGATFFQNPTITTQRGTNYATSGAGPTATIRDHAFYDRHRLNPPVSVPSYSIALNATGKYEGPSMASVISEDMTKLASSSGSDTKIGKASPGSSGGSIVASAYGVTPPGNEDTNATVNAALSQQALALETKRQAELETDRLNTASGFGIALGFV